MSLQCPELCYICNDTSATFLSGYNPSMLRAVLSAVVCDGKKSFVVEF